MRFLLDTHALIWLLGDPSRIPVPTLDILSNPTNELIVSAVTPFELATKHRIGKFPEAQRLILAWDDFLAELGATELPITSRHGLIGGQLSWPHRDPFDRILAAQSITENLPLVTSDAVFESIAGVRTVW